MKELEWGETPWDALERDELLREVQRMASALMSANSVMRMTMANSPSHPYWTQGTGARAVAKCDQALARTEEYNGENMYRSFFRYADDLLFDCNDVDIGFGWAVCPICNSMYGETADKVSSVGQLCHTTGCVGTLRALTWDDLKPH